MTENLPYINQQIQQYFDKVLVLTTHRFKERQQRITKLFSGIDFEFFYGVDKNQLTREIIHQQYHYDKKKSLAIRQVFRPMNEGELACALSHRNIYQTILDKGWNRVLILEDDAVPVYHQLQCLYETLQELPPDWELFYLGYNKNTKPTLALQLKQLWYCVMCMAGLSKMPLYMVRNIVPKPYRAHVMKAGFHDCTHAYAITRAAAATLIAAQSPVQYRSDNLLAALVLQGRLQAYASKIIFFNQEIFTNKIAHSFVRQTSLIHVE